MIITIVILVGKRLFIAIINIWFIGEHTLIFRR